MSANMTIITIILALVVGLAIKLAFLGKLVVCVSPFIIIGIVLFGILLVEYRYGRVPA